MFVCAMLYIIRFINNWCVGLVFRRERPPAFWEKYRNYLTSGREMSTKIDDKTDAELSRTLDKRSSKFRHAIIFIKYMSHIFSDAIPTDGDVRAIPFSNVTELQKQYEQYAQSCSPPTPLVSLAKLDTFRKAFKSLKGTIRLLGCKGNFQTCDICNCANDLLKAKDVKFSKEQREAILKWKRLHLILQAEERDELDKNRNLAKCEREQGQFKYAFF